MGTLLPHPNSYNGRSTVFRTLLISPESVAEFGTANVNLSLTDQIEGAINKRIDDIAEAGGHLVHIEYNLQHNALFYAALTAALPAEKVDEANA
jgi:hypothetical protein